MNIILKQRTLVMNQFVLIPQINITFLLPSFQCRFLPLDQFDSIELNSSSIVESIDFNDGSFNLFLVPGERAREMMKKMVAKRRSVHRLESCVAKTVAKNENGRRKKKLTC